MYPDQNNNHHHHNQNENGDYEYKPQFQPYELEDFSGERNDDYNVIDDDNQEYQGSTLSKNTRMDFIRKVINYLTKKGLHYPQYPTSLYLPFCYLLNN